MSGYVLGVNPQEHERLRFQQEVWGPSTRAFLTRLGVAKPARCLDLGCGPGFVLDDLRQLAGEAGSVVALDESRTWIDQVKADVKAEGWSNVHPECYRIEDAPVDEKGFDLVFSRWVLSFLPNPGEVIRSIVKSLTPGGVLAIQDYNHEGVSVFPESDGFRAVVRATRALYASRGGDPWIAARMPRLFREARLRLVELTPQVLCGGPGSPVFEWADRFFPAHSEAMVNSGILTKSERAQFLAEWAERKSNPDSMFFSPVVVCAAAVKPRSG